MADNQSRSFIATLWCTVGDRTEPVDYLRSAAAAGSGWLIQQPKPRRPLELRFEFIEDQDTRLLYRITGAPSAGDYAGAVLGVSTNGYVGFYNIAKGARYWKLEVLATEGDTFEFYLRDERGYRVGVHKTERDDSAWSMAGNSRTERLPYLNVEQGDVGYFSALVLRSV